MIYFFLYFYFSSGGGGVCLHRQNVTDPVGSSLPVPTRPRYEGSTFHSYHAVLLCTMNTLIYPLRPKPTPNGPCAQNVYRPVPRHIYSMPRHGIKPQCFSRCLAFDAHLIDPSKSGGGWRSEVPSLENKPLHQRPFSVHFSSPLRIS